MTPERRAQSGVRAVMQVTTSRGGRSVGFAVRETPREALAVIVEVAVSMLAMSDADLDAYCGRIGTWPGDSRHG